MKVFLKDRLNGKIGGGLSKKFEFSVLVELNSRNFDELVIKSKEVWIVEFFVLWYVFIIIFFFGCYNF